MPYTLKEISDSFHGSISTLKRRIRELKTAGKFEKKSPGSGYDEKEVKKISILLNFTFKNNKKT
jgi:hypothetical protein